MCLWLLTACIGILHKNPSPVIVVPAVPAPILMPTTAATTTTTRAPGNMTMPMPPGNMTMPMPPGNMTMPMPPGNMTMPMPPGNMTMPMPTGAPTVTGAELTDLILCNDPDVVCVFNPDEIAGSLPIDPRLGTTPPSSAAFQVPAITGYGSQISYDSAVKFPREKRSARELSINDTLVRMITERSHSIRKRQACQCVPAGTCIRAGTNYGAGMIDIRIVTPSATCPTGQEYCCTGTTSAMAVACGVLQTVPSTGVTPGAGQASYGEYPWQAIILTKQNDYIAGGVLIDSLNVLTVTHRLVNYVVSGTAPNVKVRFGEWDAAGTYEPIPFQEYNVAKVFTHPSYNPNTLQYDITVLRLSSAVPFTPATGAVATINRACLPASSTTVYNGQRCWVAGWGKNMFGLQGQFQKILKKVDVPIVAPATCQSQLQAARLGSGYVLDTTSFVCAGGEANKDSCTGDGGSGLVCQVNGRYVVVGLVAWGLGCASANVPAAYVNVAGLLPWIQMQVAAA